MTGDGGCTAVTLGGGGVSTAEHRQSAVLTGCEGGLVAAAAPGRFSGGFSLLQVILQQLFTGRKDFL